MSLWIWGLVVTIIYWNEIPLWAKILAIIGLCGGISVRLFNADMDDSETLELFNYSSLLKVGFPITTLLVVYLSRTTL